VRLFVALDVPAPARDALAAVARAADPAVWRAVATSSLHITLAFLGAREPGDVAPVVSSLDGAPAPALALGSVLLLPPRRARVLAVAIEDRDGALGALQARVSDALVAAGVFTPEKRPFSPHVTVARLRPRTRPPRDAAAAVDRLQFRGEAITLYASHLHPSGARYEAVSRAILR
jgi:RNA 2',3'-cyclic 3'-phosphodiesterase